MNSSNETFHSNESIMVLGNGKEGALSLGIEIESVKLFINRNN